MAYTGKELCWNCIYSLSEHQQLYVAEWGIMTDTYLCPCDSTGKNFYQAVAFVQCTDNLHWLERKQAANEIIRR